MKVYAVVLIYFCFHNDALFKDMKLLLFLFSALLVHNSWAPSPKWEKCFYNSTPVDLLLSFFSPVHWRFSCSRLTNFETVILSANMSFPPICVHCSLPSELGKQCIVGHILHEDPEWFLCMSYSWVTENDTHMIQGWYGVTRQLQPPVSGLYKSHLHARPVFHKKAMGFLMTLILQLTVNNTDIQLYNISIIYSCLDFPVKSQTTFC